MNNDSHDDKYEKALKLNEILQKYVSNYPENMNSADTLFKLISEA